MKSKCPPILIFIIGIILLEIVLLTGIDSLNNMDYLMNEYFKSENFFGTYLQEYESDVRALRTEFEHYPQKKEGEKITDEEVFNRKGEYYNHLEWELDEIENRYDQYIEEARRGNHEDTINGLIEEKKAKQEEIKKTYTKSFEELKTEMIKEKDEEYIKTKKRVENNKDIKYYIVDKKSKKVYTNKNGGLYTLQYIKKYGKDDFGNVILSGFKADDVEVYYIIPKNSKIQEDKKYHNEIRKKVIIEAVIGIILFIMTIFTFIKKRSMVDFPRLKTILQQYRKIPLDIRILLFLLGTIIFRETFSIYEGPFFYISSIFYQWDNGIALTTYTLYLCVTIYDLVNLIDHKEDFYIQWSKSVIYKLTIKIEETLSALKGFLHKNRVFRVLALLLPMGVFIKKIGYLNEIAKGTEEILNGNLEYTIEEKGKDELYQLAHNINNMKKGIKKSVESQIKSERLKSELITNVSHDLKTPLTSIINYISLLKKESLSKEEIQGYVGVLDRKAERLKVLIDDLFEASKISSGAIEFNYDNVNVVSLLEQAMGEFDEKIKNSSLTFKVNVPKEKVYLQIDGKRTWRVFENLISNILKYSQEKSRVYINLLEEEDSVKIIMKNISAYEMDFDIEEIFERFKRGDQSRHTEGSGLGLAIAKSIVELQGGKLDINIDGDLFKIIIEFKK